MSAVTTDTSASTIDSIVTPADATPLSSLSFAKCAASSQWPESTPNLAGATMFSESIFHIIPSVVLESPIFNTKVVCIEGPQIYTSD